MTFNELEEIRKSYQSKRKESFRKILGIIFIVYLAIFIITIINNSSSTLAKRGGFIPASIFSLFPVTLYFLFFGFGIAYLFTYFQTRDDAEKYRDAYKHYFITSTFNKVFTNVIYSHKAKMPKITLQENGMIDTGDRYSSNDYTRAKYKGIPFEQADVHIEERHTDSDGDVEYDTIFRGRYIIFDLKKDFKKKLLVSSKYFSADKHDSSFKKIELESNEFNKMFNIYAQDGFEAYYLLDPAVMEKIMKLSDLHNGKIMVSFSDGKMHIAINNHTDSFEPAPANKPIDEKVEFNKVINDIKVVTNIIDVINLVK